MDHAERTHHGATRSVPGGSSSAITASVLSLAPRLASTSARAAAPRRARRTGSPIRLTTASSSSRSVRHLHGRAVGEKRVGDLREVLHVRAEDDRLAVDRRLEDVVPAGRHEAAADEHRRGDLIELRELADRVEDHRVDARLGVDRQLAAPHRRQPLLPAQALDLGEPLRMPRGENQQRVAARLRRRARD